MAEDYQYQYSPLPGKGYIRLLRILPFNSSSKILRCRLITCLLESCRPFTALSYTWALPTVSRDNNEDLVDYGEEHTIQCEAGSQGQERTTGSLPVTENLFNGLFQLATPVVYPSLLWIDALCINQKDLDERGSQVSLMGQIYSTAAEVLVWLGNDMSGLNDFLWLHQNLLPKIRDGTLKNVEADDPIVLSTLEIESTDRWNEIWRYYLQFYRSNRWFGRAWIVQEICLAKKIGVRCGPLFLSWDNMVELADFLSISGWRHYLETNVMRRSSYHPEGEIGLLRVFQYLHQNGPEHEDERYALQVVWGAITPKQRWYAFLGHIITLLRNSDATDPKDKIFSILGLVMPLLSEDVANPIVPRYSGTASDLYSQVTTLLLQQVPLLSILSCVEDKSFRILNDLPSWVPDYTFRRTSAPLAALGMRIGPRGKGGPGRIYNSSRAPDMGAMSPQIHGSILSLSGACLDTVVGPFVSIQDTIQSASIQPFLDLCLSLDVVYTATNQVREEVLWRTWIGDFDEICPAPGRLATSFRSFICYHVADKIADLFLEDGLVQFEPTLIALEILTQSSGHLDILPNRKEIVDSSIYLQTYRNLLRNPSLETENKNDVRELDIKIVDHAQQSQHFDRAQSATLNRGLFQTSKGFLGLGPCSIRAGDEVWMLQNALVPFILRKKEYRENYTLIGEAYLHGFMQGEMLTPEFVEKIGVVNIA